MITIKNNIKKIKINKKKIKKLVTHILKFLKYEDFDIGIWFTTNATIKKYNKNYRKKDKATDILSFPFHTQLKAGEKITIHSPDGKNLGDIIISLEYAKKDALHAKRPFYEHLKILLVHGICHLLGYDHKTDEDFKKMQAKETSILKKLGQLKF